MLLVFLSCYRYCFLLLFFFSILRRPPTSTLFPYTTLFRSLEYHTMLTQHTVIAGTPPFDGARVRPEDVRRACETQADRKSTRLNSSHTVISYAVFCLKKKKTKHKCQWHTKTIAYICTQHAT